MSRLSLVSKILCSANATQVLSSRGVVHKKIDRCTLPVCDTEILEPVKNSVTLCEAGRFIEDQYFPYEPLLFANQIRPTQTLILYYQQAAVQGNLMYSAVVAKTGIQKLGLAIAHPLSKTAYHDLKSLAKRIKDKPTRNYIAVLAELEKKVNVMAIYNAKRVLSIDVLATTVDYRRRGISKQILGALMDGACKQKYDVVKLITSSQYGFKAAASLGFTPTYQGDPESLRDETGEALAPTPLCLPHKLLRVMIKDLRLKKRT